MKDHWTALLLLALISDSAFTAFLGGEASPIMLKAMQWLHIDLNAAMVLRLFYCAPLVFIVDRYQKSQLTLVFYCALYVLGSISTILFMGV